MGEINWPLAAVLIVNAVGAIVILVILFRRQRDA